MEKLRFVINQEGNGSGTICVYIDAGGLTSNFTHHIDSSTSLDENKKSALRTAKSILEQISKDISEELNKS